MPFRPIQWARQTVEGRQIEADGSRLLDFYAVQLPDPGEAKVPVMLYGTPGTRRWVRVDPKIFDRAGTTITPPKGIHALLEIDNAVYGHRLFGLSAQSQFFELRVGSGLDIEDDYDPFRADNPDTVYTVNPARVINFESEPDREIPVDQPRKMVTDGRRILFVARDRPYMYDIATDSFLNVTFPVPVDLATLEDANDQDWVDCAWIDGYFLLASRHGQFFHSRLDSSQFDQLDFASAESNPDDIVGLAILNRQIYILGTRTIEQWFNAGAADFAFRRRNDLSINVGCAAQATIQVNESHVIFLGSNGIVYALSGGTAAPISSETVAYDIDRSIQSEARAYTYTEEGHRFYVLTLKFPDDTRRAWAFDFATGLWHERGATDILCAATWRSGSVRRLTLVGRQDSDSVSAADLDFGVIESDTGVNQAIEREAISPLIFANLQRVINHSFQIDIPPRPGTGTISFSYSDDGRRNWRPDVSKDFVTQPDDRRIRFNRLGQFRYGRNFRIQTTAQRRVDILGAYIETDVAED